MLPALVPMLYLVPLLAVILVAVAFPNEPIASAAYVVIALYAAFLTARLIRKASTMDPK